MGRLLVLLVLGASLTACRGDAVEQTGADASGNDVAPDSNADETTPIDSGAIDAGAGGDAGTVDSGTVDSSIIDSGTVDSGTVDTGGASDTISSGCPSKYGPPMVFLAGQNLCIDSTEVTEAQYNVFLLATDKPKAPKIPAFCETRPYRDAYFSLDLPAVQVEWCNAFAYCAWAGKRLCGRHGTLGGGTNPESAGIAPSVSQWTYACRSGDPGTTFPYGATFDASKCVNGVTSRKSVSDATYAGCHGTGAFAGILHMSGNVREWEDSCNGPIDATSGTSCRTRGGYFSSTTASELMCDGGSWGITNRDDTVGFRCCADLP